MTLYKNLDKDLVNDFFDEFDGSEASVIAGLEGLQAGPNGKTTINQIFRGVHSIKSNLHMLGLNNLTDLVHHLETVLDFVRQGSFEYYQHFGTLIPLCLKLTRAMAECEIGKLAQREDLPYIIKTIAFISSCPENQRSKAIWDGIAAIDPKLVSPQQKILDNYAPATKASPDLQELKVQADLDFFRKLNRTFEKRSPYWAGRAERILTLSLAMNEDAGNLVNRLQLTAAVFVHDLGMASLSMKLIHGAEPLNKEDWSLVKAHPKIAYDLLKEFQDWNEAATITLQHQERFDGTGYPTQLSGESIHPGAKILAITDAFEAITHLRSYHDPSERTMLHGIIEINNQKGSQFCPIMVEHFNTAVRKLYKKS